MRLCLSGYRRLTPFHHPKQGDILALLVAFEPPLNQPGGNLLELFLSPHFFLFLQVPPLLGIPLSFSDPIKHLLFVTLEGPLGTAKLPSKGFLLGLITFGRLFLDERVNRLVAREEPSPLLCAHSLVLLLPRRVRPPLGSDLHWLSDCLRGPASLNAQPLLL